MLGSPIFGNSLIVAGRKSKVTTVKIRRGNRTEGVSQNLTVGFATCLA